MGMRHATCPESKFTWWRESKKGDGGLVGISIGRYVDASWLSNGPEERGSGNPFAFAFAIQ